MSDFFAGVHGAKFPEVVMNSGPLPPADGLPAPLHDTADARINYNSTLLGNLDPYAYGEPGYLSSQVSYVNQPHRIQKIIPPLRLPSPQANTLVSFDISHAVDDSDIVFCMRLDRASTICSMLGSKGAARHRVSTSLDAFINLPTLNYLLAGIQLCYVPTHPEKSKWSELLHDLDQYRYQGPMQHLGLDDIRYIVRDLIRPFGVMRGSEKQGGQDETGLASATWPVNFVANLVLDGKERNIVNVWHNHDISAGDDLVLRLRPMPIPSDSEGGYTLNHYYKRYVQQNFASYFQTTLGGPHATHVWQLVPDVFSLDYSPENDRTHGSHAGHGLPREPLPHVVMSPGFEVPRDFVWQEQGFWHIGRSQVMVRRFALREYYFNDMANNLKINHLDMTFEPTWTKVPGEERSSANPRSVRDPDPGRALHGIDRTNVMPGMMGAEFGDGGPSSSKRVRWAPQLDLERFLRDPMPEFEQQGRAAAAVGQALPRQEDSSHQSVLRLFGPPSAPSYESVARMFSQAPPRVPFASPPGALDLSMPPPFPPGGLDLGMMPPPFPPGGLDLGMPPPFPPGALDLLGMPHDDDGLSPLLSSLMGGDMPPPGHSSSSSSSDSDEPPSGEPPSGDGGASDSGGDDNIMKAAPAASKPAQQPSSRPQGLGALFASAGRGRGGAKKKPPPAAAAPPP